MPEVVYPSNGRTWVEVFPDLPNECDDWACISDILLAIAMNNRFGNMTVEELRAEFTKRVDESLGSDLEKTDDPVRKASIRKAKEYYHKYIPLVFDNLGGAYREYK